MLKLLAALEKELGAMFTADDIATAKMDKVQEGEVVIATLTDKFLQGLVLLNRFLTERFLVLKEKVTQNALRNIVPLIFQRNEEEHDPSRCPECLDLRELSALSKRLEFIGPFAWAGIRAELDEKQVAELERVAPLGKCLGLCEGWQIVAIPDPDDAE